MTLEEKAGMMFHTQLPMNLDGSLVEGRVPLWGAVSTADLVASRLLNHFNLVTTASPKHTAEWNNRIQWLAEDTRLGIPVTISSDPRHSFANTVANMAAKAFSHWPEPLGLAAIGDAELVEQFGDIARQEYVAVGIRVALHPMADLAIEARWAPYSRQLWRGCSAFGAPDCCLHSRISRGDARPA